METRVVEEAKVYKLLLNDMRSPKIEILDIAAVSDDGQKLQNWHDSLLVECYYEEKGLSGGRWGKQFQKGSPLEWYNPISSYDRSGIYEEWVYIQILQNMRDNYLFID